MRRLTLVAGALVTMAVAATPAAATSGTLIKVAPKRIDLGTRAVTDPPTDYYDGVKVTNASRSPLQVIVTAGLPDDFGFGLMPGSTCPVFTTDPPMDGGDSCRAVVRFTPTQFFAGSRQTGTLTVTATDPDSGQTVASVEVPVSGTGRL